jgi:hypothetical protein
MIRNQAKYDLGVEIAKTRTHGRSTDEKMTQAEQDLRGQVIDLGGWDEDAQMGYDDHLREHVQTRPETPAQEREDDSE